MQLLNLLAFGFSKQLKPFSAVNVFFVKPVLRLRLSMLALCLLLMGSAVGQATVMTDKADYYPGEYVIITGSGWIPGQVVSFQFEEFPKPATCMLPHDITVVADANGNIWNADFLVKENHRGVTFHLLATQSPSGLTADTWFTDATYEVTTDMNWSQIDMNGNQPGVQSPTSGDLIRVKKGAKLTVDINNAVCSSIELGYNSGNQDDRGSGTLFFLSSTSQVTVSGNVTIGDNPRLGSIDMTNGGVIIQNGNNSNFTLNNGSFIGGTGLVFFNSGGNRTISSGFTGSNAFNNVTIATQINGAITINGICQINGGNFQNVPTYGANSTLIYNTNYGTFNEWTGGASTTPTAGLGVPANVTFLSGTVTLAGNKGVPGNIFMNGGGLNLGTGDLYLGGNFTHNGSFVNNGKAVFFVGSAVEQTINAAGGGVSFSYLIIDKPSGKVKLQNSTFFIDVNGSAGNTLQLLNAGQLDLNGGIINLNNSGGFIYVNGSRTISSSTAFGRVRVNAKKTVANNSGVGSLLFDSNVRVELNAEMDFGFSSTYISTIAGELEIKNGGFVTTDRPPFYSVNSLLRYNTSANYGAGAEWFSNTFGEVRGVPYHVEIANGELNFGSNNTARELRGNMTLAGGGRNLYLPTVSGGDLKIKGNWINNGGTFFYNGRAIYFNGTGVQTIAKSGGEIFGTTIIEKSAGEVSLLNDIRADRLIFANSNTANVATGSNTMFVFGNNSTDLQKNGGGYVNGNLRRNIAAGSNTYLFSVGTGSGYTPASIQMNGANGLGSLLVNSNDGDQSSISTATNLDENNSVNRYWNVTNSGVSFTNYDITLDFLNADKDAGLNTSTFIVGKLDGNSWSYPSVSGRNSNNISASGLTSFSSFAAANPAAPPSVTTQPIAQSVCAAAQVTFSATADAPQNSAITAQWQEASAPYTVWTNVGNSASGTPAYTSTFSFTVSSVDNNKKYRVVFSNNKGETISNEVLLTVNEAPVVSASNLPVSGIIVNDAGVCTASVEMGSNLVVSGKPAPVITYSLAADFNTTISSTYAFPVGSTTVYVKTTNICGEAVTSFTITVTDKEKPVKPTIAAATGECSVTVTAPTTTDNCSGTITGTTSDPLTYSTQGTYTITWSFDDGNGNVETATQTVIVDDISKPVKPTIATATGECSVTVTAPTTTDNCSGTITGTTSDPLTYSTQGTYTITWSFDDGNGNVETATQTVIVDDITKPVKPTIAAATGECSVTVTAPTTTDNCSGTITGTTSDPLTYSTQGTYTITWSFDDGNGNVETATQTVIVDDITKPVKPTIAAATGECSVTVTAPTTTDNCSGTITGTTSDPLTYSTQGTYTITWSFDDGNGNVETATQTVIVDDITKPVKPTIAAATGECSVTVTAPTTTDNCSGTITGTTSDPLTYSTQGTYTITWSFDDGNGNVETATQTVIVDDISKPVKPTITTATGECSVTVTAPTTTDNCSGTITGTTSDPLTYSTQGTYTITWSFDDGNGNVETATQTVIVDDVTAPVAKAKNITVQLNAAGNVTITASQVNDNSTDNCSIKSIVLDKTAFNCSDLGTNTVTLTVTDIGDNVSTTTAVVTVQDVTAPTVLTKNITVNLDASGNASITAAQVDNGSSDVCGPVTLSVSPSTFNCSNVSLPAPTDLFISEYIEGISNNKAIEIYNGTGSSINLGAGGYAIRVYSNGSASFSTISLTGTVSAGDVFVISHPSANATILGQADQTSSVISFNGNDAVALVKGSTIIDVIGQIGNDPGTEWGTGSASTADNTIRRKSSINKGDSNGSDAFNPATEWDGFATDVANGLGSHSFVSGAIPVTLTVTDGSGNQSTGTAYVTVIDNIAPSLTPAANQNVNLGASCSIVVPDVRGTATDNCAGVTITQSPLAGSSISLTHNQTTSITVTATDASGNTTVKTVVLTAKDVTPPVLTPAANQNVNLNTSCSIVVPNVIGTATDNCTGVTIAQSPVAGTVIPLAHNQTYNITVTATDAAGLTDIKTVVLTAKDVTAPTVITKNITVQLDANGNASITPADVNNGSTDNCGTVNLQSVTPATFNCTNVVNGTPADLFISEYIEGSGNIKAIEIFNGTGSSINLSNYAIRFYSNGNTSVGTTINLSGTIAAGDVFVLATATASTAILAQADQTSTASFYNGNDAVTLAKNGTNIDIFGRIGEDPGAGGWTAVGGYATTDKTLRRKTNVIAGISANPTSGFPTLASEWEVFPTDNADGIGKHGLGTPVTLTVNDGNGNLSTGIAYVKVEDKIKPVITTNGDKTVNTDPGVCGATVTVSASATDNCSVGAVTGVRSDGLELTALYPVGTTTIKWNVTDINGNAAIEVTQTVVVTDNEKPVITTNGDKTVNTDPGVCGATITVSASATDNCSVGAVTGVRSDGLALTALYPVGTTTIKWNVTDINGNGAIEVTQTVVVTDNEKPVITTNGDKTVNTDPGVCGATVTVSASATDNCSVGAVTGVRSDGLALTALYPVGTTTIKWNVTDVNGNAAIEVTQTVVVTDNEKPVITSNGNKTVNTDPGVCGATVTVSASATDNCSVGAVTGVRSDGLELTALYPVGTTTIKWNVTDINGNAAIEVTQTVVVTDNEKPVITTNGDKTVNTDPGVCGATVTVSASATDNCSVGAVTGVRSDGLELTALYPVGTTTIKWNVTDINGNGAIEVTQTVVVTDNEKPVITTNGDKTVNTDPGVCGATVTVSASATDNCSVGAVTGVRSDGLALTALYPVGTTTIKWNVTDVNGNAAIEVTQTVVVTDNEKPVITTNGDKTVNTDPGVCGATVTVSASATDNCSVGAVTGVRSDGLALTALYPVGTTTIKWNVTDVNGNAAIEVTQTVVVTDNEKPVITTNGDKTVNTDPGVCGATVTVSASATDNCSVGAVTGVRSDGLELTALYPVGTTTIKWNVTDINGNAAIEVTQTVVVTDNEQPNAIAQNVTIYLNASGTASTTAAAVNNGSSDNCGVATLALSKTDFNCSNVGDNTVTLTVTDVNGNSSTATATVTVVDNIAPTAVAQNVTIYLNASGTASTTAAAVNNGSSDNCGVATLALSKTSFDCSNVGNNTVTLTVTDVNGNSSTATATVTVVDNIAPTALAQNVTIYLNASGTASTTAVAVNNGSSDNCGVATLALSKTDFNCSNVGDNSVTLTVTDVNSNSSTATATVTVVDNIAPTAVAQNVTIYLNASGTASTTAAAVNNGSSDNCGVATLALSKTSFDCSNVGDNSVTLTVTDVNGNSSTAIAIVTVKDEVAPVAKCQNIAVYLDQSGRVSITASQINNGSTDACGIASISISQTLFTAAGTYPVILTVTDVNGNSSTCSATVTVNKRPVTLVYNGDNSEQYSDQQMLSATLTDVLSGTPLSGKTITFTIGTQSVTAVTNASGIASATLILTQNPDLTTYTVKSVFNGDATYVAGNDEDAFDITDEDARAEYIGTQFQATASATSGTATVQLQASILDITAVTGNPATDAYAGTITNARVKFVLYNGSTFTDISGWLPPALINSSDSKVGVVSFDWPVNIGTADAAQYNVGIVIDNGYYIGEAPVNTITVVTVYKPLGDFVTGGGYIIPTQSGGTYASTPGLKMNFGLNVKYNKKGTNLQGGVNMIFRRNVGGVIRTYQIKSNSMTSLGTSGTSTPVVDRYAEFLSKANLTDVTNPLAPVALGGNLDLRVSMRDRGEPGGTDEIAVTLFSGTGSLLFSSKWTGSSSQRMVLTGGNIVVRGDNYGAAPAVKLAGPSPTTNSITDNFNVKVLGNPSLATFRLQLQSSDKQQKITVKIVDVNGRIVEVKENLYAGQVIEVGAKYTQGTYFAEVMQGTNRKVVKLLKIARD